MSSPANLINVKGSSADSTPAFFGAMHNPFAIAGDPRQPRFRVPNLNPAHDVDSDRLTARRALLDNIDARAKHLGHTVAGQNLGAAFTNGRMGAGQEPRTMFGQSMLMARRLIEAGVRLVLVSVASETGENTRYDTHGIDRDPPNFPQLRKVLPETDAALAALLLTRLGPSRHDAGGLDRRNGPDTPKTGGRDHWPHCYSALLAGVAFAAARSMARPTVKLLSSVKARVPQRTSKLPSSIVCAWTPRSDHRRSGWPPAPSN